MPDTIAWSFNASSSAGGASKAAGKAAADATLSVARSLKKNMGAPEVLSLQLETAVKIVFFAATSTLNDGKVTLKADGDTVAVTGPLVLHGNALALFAGDLSSLTVRNQGAEEAQLSILIGYNLL